jgi:hypothetical protein
MTAWRLPDNTHAFPEFVCKIVEPPRCIGMENNFSYFSSPNLGYSNYVQQDYESDLGPTSGDGLMHPVQQQRLSSASRLDSSPEVGLASEESTL